MNLISTALLPKRLLKNCGLWQVFWLTLLSDAFPSVVDAQWRGFRKRIKRLTAAGTAPVFHRIPCSSGPE